MHEADALVIERVRSALTPDTMDRAIDKALKKLAERQRDNADTPALLEAEARKLRKELERFLKAIADGRAPASIVTEIKRRETRLAEVEQELQTLAVVEPPKGELERLKASFRERLERFD